MMIMKCAARGGKIVYAIVDGKRAFPLRGRTTVRELFKAAGKKPATGPSVPLSSLTPLAPTDDAARVFCAGLNYMDHAIEVRMPAPKNPIFFTKTSGSLCGARDDIPYPESVRLLDYEIELAVILGRRVGARDVVTAENLPEFALGVSVFNDISARDVQLMAGQWFLGKTYRNFAPLGPYVRTLDAGVMDSFYSLELDLKVYGPDGAAYPHKRQHGTTGSMIFKTHDLINCLAERFDLLPGDVIATGTPRGVALGRPSRFQFRMAEILGIPQGTRTAKFIAHEIAHNDKYLVRGDVIEARIASADGAIDLGAQRTPVR
jgi:2-keto-4-pentenoate hydratase/2-oxohepta-3-ene-1,7-dioic acid hydratase in catechol pathway